MAVGERLFGSKWFKEQVEKEAKKDEVSPSERIGQLFGVVVGAIVIAFFAIHQTRPTGFFTDDFGTVDAALLYALIVLGMVSSLVRFVFSRKNVARPFDVAGMAVFFVAGLYFLVAFPFDFTHFAEPFPRALEFLLDWITGTFAKWVIGIGVVASPFFSVYTFLLYVGVKKRSSEIDATSAKAEPQAP
jgi:cytochrome bd-type quinol oxidase subunit 2